MSAAKTNTNPVTISELHSAGILRELDVHMIASLARSFEKGKNRSDDLVKTLLALALHVTDNGDICLDLDAQNWAQVANRGPIEDAEPEEQAAALWARLPSPNEARKILASDEVLVGDAAAGRPFVLNGNRLYLRRFWNYEKEVADTLRSLAEQPSQPLTPAMEAEITTLALPGGHALSPNQKEAVRKALQNKLTIITGGPGTGKTTVAATVLKMLAQQRHSATLRVRLAAPTGKAAARLEESVGEVTRSTSNIEAVPAQTLERLLGYRPGSPYFRHNREHPLPADVVVVDEASMIDLPKMAKLLKAIGKDTRLVLLGDKNQLASVDPGSVMAEICEAQRLSNHVVELTENKRFGEDSAVAPLSRSINKGDSAEAWKLLNSDMGATDKKVTPFPVNELTKRGVPPAFVAQIKAGFEAFRNQTDPGKAFAELSRFRVLCALRRGRLGAMRINRDIEDILFPNRRGEFYAHRVLIVTENDYTLQLYNGDVGIVLPDPTRNGEPAVYFENRGTPVSYHLLPPHETAFAMTVHKAQGSGFGRVLVVLPAEDSPILTRELLYTAITRTETGVDLWCEELSFKQAIQTRTQRSMGLKARLDAD